MSDSDRLSAENKVQAQLVQAKTHYLNAEFAEAQAAYRAILHEHHHNEARHMLGLLSIQQGRYEEAKQLLETALQIAPDAAEIRNHFANVLASTGDREAAIQQYQLAIESDPSCAAAYNNLGNVYRRTGELQLALEQYHHAVEVLPDYDDAHYNLGFTYLALEDFEKARIYLGEFVAHSLDDWRLEKVQYQLGHIALQDNRYEEACVHYEACLHLNPKHPEARKYFAFSAMKQGKNNDAITQFSVYLMQALDDVEAHYNLGVLLQQSQQLEQAFYHFKEVVCLEPLHAAAHHNLGILALKQGRQTAAIEHFKQALSINPDQPNIQYTLTALQKNSPPARAPASFIESLYDDYASHYDTHMQDALKYQVPEDISTCLARFFLPNCALSILELGCGTGLLSHILKPYARVLEGMDLSAAMLKQARDRACYDKLHHGDFHVLLESIEASFDLIVVADAFIYTGDLEPILHLIRTRLTEQGSLLFTCEAIEENGADFILQTSGRYGHHQLAVKRWLTQANFQCDTMEPITLRYQSDTAVSGWLFLAKPQT